jgi:hypothetical protein
MQEAIEQLNCHPAVKHIEPDQSSSRERWIERQQDFPEENIPDWPGCEYRVIFRDGNTAFLYYGCNQGTVYPILAASGGKFGYEIEACGGAGKAIDLLYNGNNNNSDQLAQAFLAFDEFRAVNLGGDRYDLWEIEGKRDGEWYDVFDDPHPLLAEAVTDWLNQQRQRFQP